MTTLAEHIIVAGAENRPPMLEKSMYDSWASRIRLFIKGKKHGRMMLDSIDNGPLVYPTVEENGQTRPKKYSELTEAQQLQDDCDVQATNIILHGLPPDELLLTIKGKFAVGPSRVVKCYNCQGEGHMERQCTQPKRPRNAVWFKEKLMLAEAQEAGQILDEEQLTFLAETCCDPEVLSEVAYSDSYSNYMINQDVQEMQYSEQTHDTTPSAPNDLLVLSLVEQMADHVAHLDKENQTNKMVNESLITKLERYKERITIFEQRLNVDLNLREKLIDSQMDDLIRDRNAKLAAFQKKIDTLKETLSNNVKEKEFLSKTLTVFKTESIEKESNSSSIPADNVPAGSSSSIPADYVSAGHVLVSADRDRIC
ncbi:integrase, catalytic region, zinc finger, CCHC-type containing protein [Tanacetum coccineum]